MADSQQISPDEIEQLLKAAEAAQSPQAAASASPAPAPGDSPDILAQAEIDALTRAAAAGRVAAPTAAALSASSEVSPVATATRPPAPPNSSTLGDDIQLLLKNAEAALRSVDDPVDAGINNVIPFQLRDFAGAPANTEKATLELIRDVELDLRIELGRTLLNLEDVLKLQKGSVVSLDKLAGDPVDIFVNGRLIARGEVLVLNDNFCVRVAELVAGDERKALAG